jgi:hypothetical protein
LDRQLFKRIWDSTFGNNARKRNPIIKKTMQTIENKTEVVSTPAITIGNFGNARYSAVMAELFRDAQRLLDLSDNQAHAIAARLGIDLGRLNAGQIAPDGIKISAKTDKEGWRTVSEVCKMKMPNSWAMSVAVICNGLDKLRGQGLVIGGKDAKGSITKELLEAVNIATGKLFPSVK